MFRVSRIGQLEHRLTFRAADAGECHRGARRRACACAALLLLASGCGPFDEATTRVVVTPVAEGLNNPTAVLFLPDATILVAESGAGRIITANTNGDSSTLIEGFEMGTYTPYDIGPLSLAVTAGGTLVVGEGGHPTGREQVSFYGPDGAPAADPVVPVGGGDFFDVAIDPVTGSLYIASAATNRIFVAVPDASGGFGDPTTFIDDTTAEPIAAAAPAALAFDSDGRLLVGFADQQGGKIVVLDVTNAGESPFVETVLEADGAITSIVLRASDGAMLFAVMQPGGIGSIDVLDAEGNLSTFVGGLAGPTDLALDADEVLYVTLLGDPPNADAGSLAKVTIEVIEDTTSNGESANGNDNMSPP